MSALSAAESDLLLDVFNDAHDYRMAPALGCAACDAADNTDPESSGICAEHKPAHDRMDRYDALAEYLVALGLLPAVPSR